MHVPSIAPLPGRGFCHSFSRLSDQALCTLTCGNPKLTLPVTVDTFRSLQAVEAPT